MPLPLVVASLLIGFWLCRQTKYKRVGKGIMLTAAVFGLAVGYGLFDSFLYRLERCYPVFNPTVEVCESLRGASILVLGQGMPVQSDLPVMFQNNVTFMARLLEGVRVAKLVPESRLLVSIAGEASVDVKQQFLDEYAQLVDFPRKRIVLISTARDTDDEVRDALVQGQSSKPLIIASSALHVPRAIQLATRMGVVAIGAPCDFLTDVRQPSTGTRFYGLMWPSLGEYDKAQRYWHEVFGNLAIQIGIF